MSLSSALAELQENIGQEVHVSDWVMISQERINQFAEATGDFQWIHVDCERARKESPYGETIAHGYLLVSLIPWMSGVVDTNKPIYEGVKSLINYGSNKVRFVQAVSAGQRVRIRSTLVSAEEIKGSLQVTRMVTMEIEGNDKPAFVTEVISRAFF